MGATSPPATSRFLLLFISDLLIQVFSRLKLNWLIYNFIVFLIYISHPLSDILWQVRRQISCLFCCLFAFFLPFVYLLFLIFLSISAASLARFVLPVHFRPDRIFWLCFTHKIDKCYLKAVFPEGDSFWNLFIMKTNFF